MSEALLLRRVFVWLVLYQLCWQAYLAELGNIQLVSDTHTYPRRRSSVKRHENIRQKHPLRNSKFLFHSFPVPGARRKNRGAAVREGFATAPIFESINQSRYLLACFASCHFIARTFSGSPNNVMKPSASWWSYKSPVVKLARDSL